MSERALALLAVVAIVVSEAGWANPVVASVLDAMGRAPEPWPTVAQMAVIVLLSLLGAGPMLIGFVLIGARRRRR